MSTARKSPTAKARKVLQDFYKSEQEKEEEKKFNIRKAAELMAQKVGEEAAN